MWQLARMRSRLFFGIAGRFKGSARQVQTARFIACVYGAPALRRIEI
ncbi:hypothetical protein CAMGR0001_0787 [Campylobacter gracilis RM3268]|uniref:Uncharacterized protein n=1 Tax=Campylobacter gracilis RM3268 TaxID=553220 RepID=C8PFZ4_9BACT|nr:hypothetical protein CAMGR0001_0787 [Campylobacter gracilis RM3268]